jgi:hypothetical protein
MFKGERSSFFLASSSYTFSRALSARNLLIYNYNTDFSFSIDVFSYFDFRFTLSIYSSFCKHSLDTSVILFCNYCSNKTIFCYLFASSLILPFSFVSNKFRLAYNFLKCFSFSMSPFRCCSERLVQNSIYFCLRVIRVLAYSAFFQVSSSQTTLYSSSFSSILCSDEPSNLLLAMFYEGSLGS